ncbi:CxxH/CxxC protein [Bacillus salipaludis]|uniref:CxxH/CxxC protein n=2 Tax=Bacillus salipaludis TaxID=2547811 RepID=A0AA90QUU7_9BACI|nr:CxxH/CxxC protein [Bacillus salipaludis]MDQ6595313.1 CxxH/CxxC protein [Bacillus salipaludis]
MTDWFKVKNKVRENIFQRVKLEMIYCCEEHVDIALDTVVNEHETFPLLTKLDVDNLSTSCEYCRNSAVYIVANK